MKTPLTIVGLALMLPLYVHAQSSGGSPGSSAANNGGFSQPPTLAPATTPGAANPNAQNPQNFNPNINGSTPGATNSTGSSVTNSVDAFGDTNGGAASGFGTNNGVPPAVSAQNNTVVNPQSPLNRNPNMNVTGDVTNANGTMTFNTNKARWWEK